MELNIKNKKIIIICGHYGSGKTNLSLSLAFSHAEAGEKIALIDLDVVNPYFRSSDHIVELEKAGVDIISPTMAGSTLDTPSISGRIPAVIDGDYDHVIIDIGGDDAGGTVLGSLHNHIQDKPYEMIYIINQNREMINAPSLAKSILDEIEQATHLKATGIINNTHIGIDTTVEDVTSSLPYAMAVAEMCQLPLLGSAVTESNLTEELKTQNDFIPINIYVKAPWQ